MQLMPLDEAVPQASVAGQSSGVAALADSPAGKLRSEPSTPSLAPAGARTDDFACARYRAELAWLAALPGLHSVAARLLAAHAAGLATMLRRRHCTGGGASAGVFDSLARIRPDRAALEAALHTLPAASGDGAVMPGLMPDDLAQIEALWPLAAPTEYLLASGGDDRLTLDPDTGLNKYGCAPWPRPELVSFGSCTASTLSEGAFAAAEQARRALVAASLATSPATALAEASDAIGEAVLSHFDVQDLAQAVLAASGTDAALVVTSLLAAEHPGEMLTSILVSPSETGSGVPDAVQGRHFASSAPSGSRVGKGEPIDGLATGPSLVTVGLRAADGSLRPPEAVNAAFEAAIRRGVAAGRVVLHAIDGSKTGLTAPDREMCRRLSQAYGPRLDIVIDACQARVEPALVRWYLQQGFPVLITGSKFFAAPGFCGAVLFPRTRLQRITKAGRLPVGLAAYARLQGGFGSRRCPGLVLRWSAALHEMAKFGQLPAPLVRTTLDRMGRAIHAAFAGHPRLRLMDAPRPPGFGWSDLPSIFTFTIEGEAGRMSVPQLRPLYRALGEACSGSTAGAAPPCQIGQPVELGSSALGGLRMAVSAAQLACGADRLDEIRLVLARLEALLPAAGRPVAKLSSRMPQQHA